MGTERCHGILWSLDGIFICKNCALKTAVAAIVIAVALSGLVCAAPIDHGVEAAKRGDYATAMRILRPLAIKGDPRAQYNLGVIYDEGLGVQPDSSAAFSWYLKAANQRYASAQANLGVMYYTGQGVRRDYFTAYIWFYLAASAGDKDAARSLNQVAGELPSEYKAEAQRRAADWLPWTANAAPTQTAPARPASRKTEPEEFSGTAFFVSKDGKALTNAHVVQGCRQISVNTEGQSHGAKVLARDDKNDLALLATDLNPAQSANWRLQVRQGEDIVVYGFPLSGVLSSGGNVATGNVTALAGLGNDSRFLQISAPVQPGNSGGPLLDRNGSVAGIVVAKLNALAIASATGDIPQNVNFAIKASVAAAFLDAQRVTHAENAGTGALSTPDLAERARSFTVQVICIR